MAVNQTAGGTGEPEQFRRRILSAFFSLCVFNFPLSGLLGAFSAYGNDGLKTPLKNSGKNGAADKIRTHGFNFGKVKRFISVRFRNFPGISFFPAFLWKVFCYAPGSLLSGGIVFMVNLR